MRIHFKAQQIVFISFAHSCVHNIYNMYRIYTYIVYLYIYVCLPKYVAYKACIYDTSHLFICTAMFHFFFVGYIENVASILLTINCALILIR